MYNVGVDSGEVLFLAVCCVSGYVGCEVCVVEWCLFHESGCWR